MCCVHQRTHGHTKHCTEIPVYPNQTLKDGQRFFRAPNAEYRYPVTSLLRYIFNSAGGCFTAGYPLKLSVRGLLYRWGSDLTTCEIRDGRELPNLCLNVVDLVHEVQQVLKPS
jgi:hypothetical protein